MNRTEPHTETSRDPTVAAKSPAGWRAWLLALLARGRDRLVAFGLLLVLGFVLALGSLLVFAELAEDVAEGDTLQIDTGVLHWLRQFQSAVLDVAARVVSALGSEGLVVILAVILGVLVWRRRWGAGVALLIVTIGAQLLNDALKLLFHRTRPAPVDFSLLPGQSFSFPSGHAMVSAATYGFLAYLAWRLLRGWLRWAVVVAVLVLVALIGLSRLYLGVHYFSDVVAGYVAGFFWVDTVIIAGHMLGRRRPRPAAPADESASPADESASPADASDTPAPPTPRDTPAPIDTGNASRLASDGDRPAPAVTTAAPATAEAPRPTAPDSEDGSPDSAERQAHPDAHAPEPTRRR